ncbi:RING finger and WD repeat domain-containing protein 3 [Gamsiella multidivaricata]|nr:RING finger and WD repeat domain-containing protein 3 [Gamsiella multidivaricata]
MNDFEDVDDMSFVMDSNNEDEENGEGSQTAPGTQETQGTINNDEEQQHELEHDLQPDAQPPAPERLTPSQDHDFQSQAPVVVRPMLGPGLANIPEPRPQNVETEESTCSICFEHWTNSGSHRLVSIKCGHLFGESCILKWMAQRGRGGCAKCPECNHPAMRKDVRRIWSKSVVVVDTAEKDEAVARAKKEQELRLRCEQELVQSRMAYEMLRSEMTRLQNKHDRQRAFKIK